MFGFQVIFPFWEWERSLTQFNSGNVVQCPSFMNSTAIIIIVIVVCEWFKFLQIPSVLNILLQYSFSLPYPRTSCGVISRDGKKSKHSSGKVNYVPWRWLKTWITSIGRYLAEIPEAQSRKVDGTPTQLKRLRSRRYNWINLYGRFVWTLT